MDSLKPTLEELQFCMRDLKCIRNVCILAHVDHGKTTLSDLLLATNRLVSKRLAGFLRYLDDRPDEQERGITMKSSAVSLLNLVHDDEDDTNKKILLNLIDTPGHIDFSSEVEVALRVCDGAIVLVDLVEGVCAQTREAIKKAFEEKAKMILVLNKFDKLIVELQRDIDEIFQCILRVLEGCNAIVAELYQYEYMDNEVDIEDSGLLFTPDTGNVIFASSIDAWGFTTKQFAQMFIELIKNETIDSLNEKIWNFDCYIDSKQEIKTGAIDKKKTNLFIQICLKTIVHIYDTIVIRMEKDKTSVILEKLKIKNITRDMTHNDPKVQIRAIFQGWIPLSSIILLQCLKIVPPPSKLDKSKIEHLLNVHRIHEDQYLSKCIEEFIPYFESISTEAATPTFAYVSKMFCVNKKNLSQYKPKVFIPKPRENIGKDDPNKKALVLPEDKKPGPEDEAKREDDVKPENVAIDESENAIIALARVYSGTLRVEQEIYVLTSSYLPDKEKIASNREEFIKNSKQVSRVVIKELYMLFGRDLMLVDSIPAGNFCGIGGLEANVIRTATLSSTLHAVPVSEKIPSSPIVRHAIEPANPKELPILHKGLKLLMQSDSCVEFTMEKTGELVIRTAGDVHLGKCIEDLRTKFAKIEFHVSSPIVSLRETIDFVPDVSDIPNPCYVVLDAPYFSMSVIAVMLPHDIYEVVQNNIDFLRTIEQYQHKSFVDIAKESGKKPTSEKIFKSEVTKRAILHVKELLKSAFESNGQFWSGLQENIWSVGKRNDCINLLINGTGTYNRSIFMELDGNDQRALFDHCVIKAYDILCESGPICEEPLMKCAFVIAHYTLKVAVRPGDITPQVTSALVSSTREMFKKSFQKQEPRLMEPIYMTEIQVNINILGKVYIVLNRRHGRVLDAVGMDDKEKTFLVKAQIPVVESEGFANEIRKTTSGQAHPSLRFSHYELVSGDPYFDLEEGADDLEYDSLEAALRANRLMKDVRRRKGLSIVDEVVVHAEKQRTLNRKK